jgi:hypothetical protein
MNRELEFAFRIRQVLDGGTAEIGRETTDRLYKIRQRALSRYRVDAGLSLAGFGYLATESIGSHARGLLAAMALTIGAVGTYYWNTFEQAVEHAEVDSALLADEVPFNAYIDQGFMAWLEQLAPDEDSDLPSQR